MNNQEYTYEPVLQVPAVSPDRSVPKLWILAAVISYPFGYLHANLILFPEREKIGWFAALTVLFVLMTELIYARVRRSVESWILLGCLLLITGCFAFGSCRVWDSIKPLLFIHVLFFWWTMSRGDKLHDGKSGRLILFDLLWAVSIYPFAGFLLRARSLLYGLSLLRRKDSGSGLNWKTIGWSLLWTFFAVVLFFSAIGLLQSADEGFSKLMDRVWSFISIKNLNGEVIICLILACPVSAYYFGLAARSTQENGESIEERRKGLDSFLISLGKVPAKVWTVILGLFCLVYTVFIVLQARYLLWGFTETTESAVTAATYARSGFFELCQVVFVNFLLIWFVYRSSKTPLRGNKPALIASVLLVFLTMLIAITAFAKILLYTACFGFTPKRLQSAWFVVVLFAGCLCTVFSLVTGKKTARVWLFFSVITLSLLHLY